MSLRVSFIAFKSKLLLKHSRLPEWLKSILGFIRFVIEYGILISLIVYGVLRADIDIFRLLGLGILYYFVVYEIPIIYKSWKSWREA